MSLYGSRTYTADLDAAVEAAVGIERLFGSSVLVSGASGLIGSYLADMLLRTNERLDANITVYALGRDRRRLAERFDGAKSDKIIYVEHDINFPPEFDFPADYIIHAASNAHPASFNADPVGTLTANITGTKYLLDYGKTHGCKRMLYVSSGEVYGQGDLSLECFDESYSGYVDPLSARSCYPNGKRAAETLCVCYTKQFALDTVIARPSHTYGPTATKEDNRASSQFISRALAGDDIVLNSAGSQMRSYTYIADAASAILSVLTSGESCSAYNIANPESVTTIADFARDVAAQTDAKVIFSAPSATSEAIGGTPIVRQVLSSGKLESLGWRGRFTVEDGIRRTVQIMRETDAGGEGM